jgi:hypothetical protein
LQNIKVYKPPPTYELIINQVKPKWQGGIKMQEDLIAQVRALNKKANEAQLWKERYQAVSFKIKDLTRQMNELLRGDLVAPEAQEGVVASAMNRTGGRGSDLTLRIKQIVTELVNNMRVDDSLQINTTRIELALKTAGISVNSVNLQRVRQILEATHNVGRRKDGSKVWFYWKGTSNDEMLASLPAKVEYMG